ncbi:MAG TPA: hypothetical protein VGB18_07455, partial [Candidatus Thermoplasmatota archaeon]
MRYTGKKQSAGASMDLEPFLRSIPSTMGLVVALSKRARKEKPPVDAHPLRKRLLNLIRRRPGIQMVALWKQLDTNRKTTKYHLLIL